jgi:hypothetical protein
MYKYPKIAFPFSASRAINLDMPTLEVKATKAHGRLSFPFPKIYLL